MKLLITFDKIIIKLYAKLSVQIIHTLNGKICKYLVTGVLKDVIFRKINN